MRKQTRRGMVVGSLMVTGVLCFGASAAQAASLTVGTAQGAKGSQVTFSVTLATDGATVAGTENDIAFDTTNTPVGTAQSGTGTCSVTTATACVSNTDCPSGETCTRADGPDCSAGPNLANHQALFAFVGAGQMRAIVVGVSPPSTAAIPDGTVLYTCKVNIPSSATDGAYPLTISNVGLADALGATVTPATGTNGSITVGTAGCPAGDVSCRMPCECVDDCDLGGDVFGNEVTKAVNIVGGADLSTCPQADANCDGDVFGNEVTIGVNNVANGCP